MIIIPGGTDCYYYLKNMTCLIHVYYCVVVLVTVPIILSTIMLSVDTCYTSCVDALFMYTYTMHCMPLVLVYPIDTIPVCSHRYRMVAYFIYMFIFITSSLYNSIYYIKLDTTIGYDPMITC